MPQTDVLASATTACLAAVAITGLAVRHRWRVCGTFLLYLWSAVVIHALLLPFPRDLWNWTFWGATDLLQTLLCGLIAFEIAYKTFRTLPEGYHRLRRVLGWLALATAVVVVAGSTWPRNAAEWTLVSARASYGLAFLFAAFVFFARSHDFPLDPLHREIALGFVLRSLLVAFAHALSQYDDLVGLGHYSISKVAYPLILLGWVWSAWRREPPTALSPEVLRRLRPWRVR